MPTLLCGQRTENLAQLRHMATSGNGEARAIWCVTLNLEMVSRARRDSRYEALLSGADLIIADGAPIAWWARRRRAGCGQIERTTGVEVVDAVLSDARWGTFAVIGGRAPRDTIARYPDAGRRCVFCFDGIVNADDLDELVREVGAAQPNVILVALGVPKQDRVSRHLRDCLPTGAVMFGVGGSFEMLSNEGRRCPPVLARLGLEWAYRLAFDPARLWRRYLIEYPAGVPALLAPPSWRKRVHESSVLERLCTAARGIHRQ